MTLKDEYAHWKDTGCGNGCVRSLECPFAQCRYDDARGRSRAAVQARREEAVKLRREGLTVEEIVERLGVSSRTVHHYLEGADVPAATRSESARQGRAKRRERS